VSISVTNPAGVSNSVSAAMQSVLPGLFVQSGYVLAVRPADNIVINGTGAAVSGYTAAAAPGQVFSGSGPAENTVTVTIGGKAAAVLYAGLVGAGLWQINVQVPVGAGAGDNAVVASVSGSSSPSSALVKIAA
jgi:uncharacterized protein (TIGR03437 family)